MSSPEKTEYTYEEWLAESKRRFGTDMMNWKFVCPSCGYVQSVGECKSAGVPSNAIAFSCIGRWRAPAKDAFTKEGPGPCNYAGGGLIGLNPIKVTFPDRECLQAFAFAPADPPKEEAKKAQ